MLARNIIKRSVSNIRTPANFRLFSTSLAASYAKPTASGTSTHFSPPEKTVENNLQTESNRLEKTLQRFWEKVDVKPLDQHYQIQLDSRPLRTPLGNTLTVPASKKQLAYLIAHEWSNLASLAIKPHSVPLTSITARAIDLETAQTSNDPDLLAKVGKIDDIKIDLLRYLDTDTLLVFSPAEEYEGALRVAQEEIYRPIISEMEQFFGKNAGLNKPIELSYLDSDIHGLRGNSQSQEVKEAVMLWLDKITVWELVALEKATLSAKSFLSGVAIVRANSSNDLIEDSGEHLSLEEVVRAATLETIYQTERWGEVEDTHDVDKVDIRRNLGSAAILAFSH